MFLEKELEVCIIIKKGDYSCETIFEKLKEAISNGATMVRLSQDGMSYDDFLEFAKEIKRICKKYSIKLIIEDNIDAIFEIEADGMCLKKGEYDKLIDFKEKFDDKMVAILVGNISDIMTAYLYKADYIIVNEDEGIQEPKWQCNNLQKWKGIEECLVTLDRITPLPILLELNIKSNEIKKIKGKYKDSKIDGICFEMNLVCNKGN